MIDNAIRRKFAAEGFKGELNYDSEEIIETDRWWYIPCGWIGCSGCIVNRDDLYVNWLGSALSQEDYFWGHEHGIFHDIMDFTFAPDTDLQLVARLVSRFKHMHPNASGMMPDESAWYFPAEIDAAVSAQFPVFKRHFVWYAIPELREAYEQGSLHFTAAVSNIA